MDAGERIMQLETKMEVALQGVSNFRAYQLRSARHQGYMKAMAAVMTILLGATCWMVRTAVQEFRPAFKILIREYVKDHPDIKGEIPGMTTKESPTLANEAAKPQDAGNSPAYTEAER